MNWQSFFCCKLLFVSALMAAEPSAVPLKQLIPRIAPREPVEALKSFQIEKGFRIELIACEPNVVDPIAMAFDASGNLYVCEDLDYPYPAKPGADPIGRVRLLKDKDQDGFYEQSYLFAEKVHWPSGVVCWKGGIFVAAPPQILYLKDLDGDHKADLRKVVFDGFGTAAAEDIMNNLKWGLDNRIYGAASYNGGTIQTVERQHQKPVSVRGCSFRFDPNTLNFESLLGTGDFGNCFDDWGNRFVTNAGQVIIHPVFSNPQIARNPFFSPNSVLFPTGRSKRVMHSISPPEPWRVVRKRFWKQWVNQTQEMRASRFSETELAQSPSSLRQVYTLG